MIDVDKMKVTDIRALLETLPEAAWEEAIGLLAQDSREGVRKLGTALNQRRERNRQERERLLAMVLEERTLAGGPGLIAGVDEAGRGPLAGPVVAAAVILPEGFLPMGLNDSKKLSEVQRERLYAEITGQALAWAVGIRGPERIDVINILEATREAMTEAVMGLIPPPDCVLLDAVTLRELPYPQQGIIKGDARCLSIAAASIIAKVTRDRLMQALGSQEPLYGFEVHKGYGTPQHYAAIEAHGMTIHHRRSFLKGFR